MFSAVLSLMGIKEKDKLTCKVDHSTKEFPFYVIFMHSNIIFSVFFHRKGKQSLVKTILLGDNLEE